MPETETTLRVVLDTNVWISGIFFARGFPAKILEAWRDGRFDVVVTPGLVAELSSVLLRKAKRFDVDPALADGWLGYIKTYALRVDVDVELPVHSRDPHDDMFLAAALTGQVDYLITGDQDLLVLGQIGSIPIVSPRAFAAVLEAGA